MAAENGTDLDLTTSTIHHQPGPVSSGELDGQPPGPYWTSYHRTPLQDVEFESSLYIDSSLYASLNRSVMSEDRPHSVKTSSLNANIHHSDGQSHRASSQTLSDTKSETANPVGVSISHHYEEEDICTHV